MRYNKFLILFTVLAVMILGTLSSCTMVKYTRTQNVRSKAIHSPYDVRLFIDSTPTEPYTEVGIIEADGVMQGRETIFNKMKDRAYKEGADAIVDVGTHRTLNVDWDRVTNSADVDSNEVFYGRTIVYTKEGENKEAQNGTENLESLTKPPVYSDVSKERVRVSVPLPQ